MAGRTLSVLEGLARDVECAWLAGGLDGVREDEIGSFYFLFLGWIGC